MNSRPRRAPSARLLSAALVATATLGTLGFGASAANAAADPALQPALTAQDHAITDVPGLVNGRELGSFTGAAGQTVNASRLLRTESLDKITSAGAQTLASEYHVDLVIDLRTPAQVAAKPDVAIPGAQTVNISMFGSDGNYNDDTAMYHDLVDKGYESPSSPGVMVSAYAQILELLSTHTSGTVLIHCSHGMDRTGTVLDLLYRILGVSSPDILHDYLLSNTQLGVTWATPDLLQGTFEGDVAKKYGGLDAYIAKTIGVSADEAAALRTRFLVSNDATASAIRVGGVDVPLDTAATAGGATVTVPIAALAASDVQVTTSSAAATSAVTVSGQTATITITAQDGTTTKVYTVAVSAPALTLAGGTDLVVGSSVHLSGAGFAAGASYDVVVHSTPTVIGRVTAAADGSVAADLTLPASLATGAHTLFLADAQGNAVSAALPITVSAATVGTTAAAGPSVATGGTLLAQPAQPAPWPGIALGALGVMLLAAVVVLRVARARRAR
ncbi:protein tyrosine/serine phosphatase [Microbacterium testaceum StLB037]|uniref:Protein tyrosine/serine phosphatase n=1 Tax=Microbacterium testaceum (strain StLB037) TaxID=979556 RepID=E8N8B3_MICTS|nr:tyrosine-protein phosphatase [Microbacterium testaceum]BAJ74358.1 protein tyrosine/serine phosphatase [Microbacterium testaceum StLB037]